MAIPATGGPQDRPFAIKDCALISIATGRRAQNLREFRDHLLTVDAESIYHHFWGGLLRPQFDDPEYSNDFAVWARHGLHDAVLAERLAVVDPSDFHDLEELRHELVDIIEERLDSMEHVPWAKSGEAIHFIRGQLVILDTHFSAGHPEDFIDLLPKLSLGSIYYHFIDARRREPLKTDDFSVWLEGLGPVYDRLRADIRNVDPYLASLAELRSRLGSLFARHLGGKGA